MNKVVRVQFCGSFDTDRKNYSYLTDIDDIVVGDVVVVSSGPGLGVAKVKHVGLAGRAANWVIQKVDMDSHRKREERVARIAELKNALQLKKEQFDEVAVFQILAEMDPEAKNMLDELSALTG
jgi:hypothetical protein